MRVEAEFAVMYDDIDCGHRAYVVIKIYNIFLPILCVLPRAT